MSEVILHTSADAFKELAPVWNNFSRSIVFRQFDWMQTWWRWYGEDKSDQHSRRLYLLSVRDEDGQTIGLAPWYVEQDRLLGRTIRNIGSGEVCTDYVTLLSRPCHEYQVAESVAGFLADQLLSSENEHGAWQLLELESVCQLDTAARYLVDALQEYGVTVNGYPAVGCWRIELPGTVDDYDASLGASLRRRIRSAEKNLLRTGRLTLHSAESLDQLDAGFTILRELHQASWNARGLPGAYASESFSRFHEEIMLRLMKSRNLRLTWLEYEGKPVAAEYDIIERDVLYNYQVGRDPGFTQCRAGDVLRYLNICWAIQNGHKFFDFLRGDEPYKADWLAARVANHRVHAISTQPSARLRHGLWSLGRAAREWIRGSKQSVALG